MIWIFFFTPINIVTVVNRLEKHTGNRVSFMLLPIRKKKNLVSFKCLTMTPERLAQTIQITLFRAIKWRNEGREKHNKYTGALYESSDKIRLSWRGSETCVFFFTSRCRLVPYVLSWLKFFFFVSRTFTFMYNLCIKSRKQLSVGFFYLTAIYKKRYSFIRKVVH